MSAVTSESRTADLLPGHCSFSCRAVQVPLSYFPRECRWLYSSEGAGSRTDVMPASKWSGIGTLILGSKSWSRKTLLSELGIQDFHTCAANVDESSIRNSDPRKLVLLLGHAKADSLLQSSALESILRSKSKAGKTILVTGDSVVSHKGEILEKPETKDQARSFLLSYATAPATTVSSVVVVDVDSGARWEGVAEAEVHFHPMPDHVIDELVESGGCMESAGGLRIENPLVERYTDFILGEKSAVMGFSTSLAERLLLTALSSTTNSVTGANCHQ